MRVAREGDRGLTGAGAVVLALVLGLVGGAVDAALGRGMRIVFGVCFLLGCVLAAALVRRRSLLTAVAAPPLLYVVLALGSGLLGETRVPLTPARQGAELLTALTLGAPVLVGGTLLAAAVGGLRLLRR